MSLIRISEALSQTVNKLIEVLNAHLEYYQVVAFDKIVSAMNRMISSAILMLTGFMFLFFGSFALANYLGEIMFHQSAGFLIVAVLYAIGGLLLYKNRDKWIIDPMVNALSELIEETTEDLELGDSEIDEKEESDV